MLFPGATNHMLTSFALSLLKKISSTYPCTGFFPLTFPCTGWFRNYRFWDRLQFLFAFQFKVLDVDGQKICEKSALPKSLKFGTLVT
jgi:hypothetical protein